MLVVSGRKRWRRNDLDLSSYVAQTCQHSHGLRPSHRLGPNSPDSSSATSATFVGR